MSAKLRSEANQTHPADASARASFQPSSDLASSWPAASAQNPEWHGLDVTHDGSLLVNCTVDGRQVIGLLDTGASVSIIDPSLCGERLTAIKDWSRVGAEWGARTLARARSRTISLGGETLISARPILADLAWLTETTGRPIAIVIGQDILAQRLCLLQFAARRFAFLTTEPVISSRWSRLALARSAEGRLCLEVKIEDGPAVRASIDLGSSNPVMMSSSFALQRGFFEGRRLSSAATNTLSGAQISHTVVLSTMELAGSPLRAVPADAFDTWNAPEVPVNLGFPVFRRFDLMLDIGGDSLWLATTAEGAAPFDKDRSGLGLAFLGERLRVVHVAKLSPAAAGEWRVGEEITDVDNQPVDQGYFAKPCSRWRLGPAGVEVSLRGSFGVRTITLADYY